MEAKRCDRCGAFYQPEKLEHGDIVVKRKRKECDGLIFGNIYYVDDSIDLCPECSSFIKDWLNNKED